MLKIAIDSGPLSSGHAVRGIGVMIEEQIEAIKRLSDRDIKLDVFNFESEEGRRKLESGKYDVVHYPYFFPYSLTLPKERYGKKLVVTIQDLIQLIYPKQYPPGYRGKINFINQKMRLKNVDAVITISETSKKDIVRFLDIPPEKIHVIYLAPKKIFKRLESGDWSVEIKKRYSLSSRFVLYVGDVNYNKNIPGLIRACKIAKIPLVIVGKQALDIEELGGSLYELQGPRDYLRFLFNIPHPELAHYQDLIEEFKDKERIVRLGYVSSEDLRAIYNLASVYVQPSFYEGFGLPVLEAMSCGCPVLISKTNALAEVAGDAALIADPDNPKDIAEGITQLLKNKDVKDKLIERGFERVKDFSWEKTARRMIAVYKLVISK